VSRFISQQSEYIHKERPTAASLLALMSFCDRQAIPKLLLHDVRSSEDGSEDSMSSNKGHEDTFDDDMQMLENFSFVAPTIAMTAWEMHRLVQDAMQWWLLDHRRVEETKEEFVERLAKVVPTGAFEHWRFVRFCCHMSSPLLN